MRLFGPTDIKIYVRDYLYQNQNAFTDKTVVDIPAGSGFSSGVLKEVGANVLPFDLFPEFFKTEGLACKKADAQENIPLDDNCADYVLCQEGLEHFHDQLTALKEFNRVLKKGGTVLLTTPNYSHLKSKLSYFLAESEYVFKFMPPNELESIWMSVKEKKRDIYLGHIFLLGIQKIRILAKLAGFNIKRVNSTRIDKTSLYLLPLFYPLIFIINQLAYLRAMDKHKEIPRDERKAVYKEILKYNLSLSILTDVHLFVELEKDRELADVAATLHSKYKSFDIVT